MSVGDIVGSVESIEGKVCNAALPAGIQKIVSYTKYYNLLFVNATEQFHGLVTTQVACSWMLLFMVLFLSIMLVA